MLSDFQECIAAIHNLTTRVKSLESYNRTPDPSPEDRVRKLESLLVVAQERITERDATIARLTEAVEWAMGQVTISLGKQFNHELRTRAGLDKETPTEDENA